MCHARIAGAHGTAPWIARGAWIAGPSIEARSPAAAREMTPLFPGTCVAHIVRMLRPALSVAAVALLVSACTAAAEDGSGGAASEDEVVAGAIAARGSDPCTARLVFLQKDAYKSTAGRSSELWPPHTTTVLDVTCSTSRGEQHIAPFKENYGTKPGAKDEAGNEILVEIDMPSEVVTVAAPWREMKALVASYEGCGCDEREFLGLDTIDAEAAGLLEKLSPILDCPDSNEALLLALKERRFDDAKRMAAQCTIKSGVSPAELAETAAEVDAEVKRAFAEHHVCNNNAMLQADLFARFRDRHDATACDAHDRALCYGPKLFFNPKKEVR